MQRCSDPKGKARADADSHAPGEDAAEGATHRERRPERLALLTETSNGHLASLIRRKLEVSGIPCVVMDGMVSASRLKHAESFWATSRVLVPEMLLAQARSVVRSEAMLV